MIQIWCKHEKICGQIGFDWDCRDNCNKFEPDITHDHLRALAELVNCDTCDLYHCCKAQTEKACFDLLIDYALKNPKKEV